MLHVYVMDHAEDLLSCIPCPGDGKSLFEGYQRFIKAAGFLQCFAFKIEVALERISWRCEGIVAFIFGDVWVGVSGVFVLIRIDVSGIVGVRDGQGCFIEEVNIAARSK